MLKKDDWTLTLGELKSQRTQIELQVAMNTTLISMVEKKLKELK